MATYTSSPIGFGANTTGGGNAVPITVTNKQQFIDAVTSNGPKVVEVDGFFEIGYVLIESDKTIRGKTSSSGVNGTLRIEKNNVIVQGLKITASQSGADAIAISKGASDVWVDHNTIYDWQDGACDVTKGATNVTISCNYFYWNGEYDHSLAVLIGADPNDPDEGKLHVTGYLNYFGKNVYGRMPFGRKGNIHFFNNYYDMGTFNTEGMIGATNVQILAENNYFDSGEDPFIKKESGGKIKCIGNYFSPAVAEPETFNDSVFIPAYAYTLLAAKDVKVKVLSVAGSGGADIDSGTPPVDPPIDPEEPPIDPEEPPAEEPLGIDVEADKTVDIDHTVVQTSITGLKKGQYLVEVRITPLSIRRRRVRVGQTVSDTMNLTVDIETEPPVEPPVNDDKIKGFKLINSGTEQEVADIVEGGSYSISTYGPKLNIKANVTSDVTKVKFNLTGRQIKEYTDKAAPFSLHGDDGHGNYYFGEWNPPATGNYTLKATPYNASGAELKTKTINFTFVS